MEKKNYSKKLRKLMRGPNMAAVMVIALLCIGFLLVVGVFSYNDSKKEAEWQKKNVKEFNPVSGGDVYSKVVPELLSYEFAEGYDKTDYCFVVDADYYPYIVAIDSEDMEQYDALLQYTYGQSEDLPDVTLTGMPVLIDDELKEYAVKYFNTFWGSDEVDEDNFDEVFGYYYLDTAQQPKGDASMLIVTAIAAVVFLFIFWIVGRGNAKQRAKSNAMIAQYENQMERVDQEINSLTAVWKKQLNLYLTEHYLVSGARNGFVLLPWGEIASVYGHRNSNSTVSLMAVDQSGETHEVALVTAAKKGRDQIDEIVEMIKMKCPDMVVPEGDLFYSGVKEFNGADLNKVSPDVASGLAAPPKSNPFLGIVGAILGAALGGVIWVLIGKLGFIAGIAGAAMMYFAMQGYRIFSGYLDKKGEVIALLIALLMIPVANLMDFATEFCKYYMSGPTDFKGLGYVLRNLGTLISTVDGWSAFLTNLVVGYLLSIWAGFGMIRSVFRKRKKAQEAASRAGQEDPAKGSLDDLRQ